MYSRFHTPSFGDDAFDLGDAPSSTPTSSFVEEYPVNNSNSSYMHQQTAPSTKGISVHNSSDEYHTANEESFSVTSNNSMNNSIMHQNMNVLPGGQTGMTTPTSTTMAARKQMLPVDQNEPAKPLSAYALFFRDTVSAIKQQNPTCSFQELSKIVASMWDALDPAHKGVYNKKNELARTEYLKQMRIYQQQKQEQLNASNNEVVQTDTNDQYQTQQVTQPPITNNTNVQQNAEQVNNNNVATANNTISATTASANSSAPSHDQLRWLTEAGLVQKCTRENCNKRAIINPDWEDEYCSNECVIIHCRNVFNAWVQSNLEAKQQQQQQQITQQTTTT